MATYTVRRAYAKNFYYQAQACSSVQPRAPG